MSKKSRDKDSIIYEFNPDGPNVVTDELSATSFMALREVHWNVEDDYHLDFRRYFVKPDGTEMPGKGTAIPSPDKLISLLSMQCLDVDMVALGTVLIVYGIEKTLCLLWALRSLSMMTKSTRCLRPDWTMKERMRLLLEG